MAISRIKRNLESKKRRRERKKTTSSATLMGFMHGATERIMGELEEGGIGAAEKAHRFSLQRLASLSARNMLTKTDNFRAKRRLKTLMRELRRQTPPRPPVRLVGSEKK